MSLFRSLKKISGAICAALLLMTTVAPAQASMVGTSEILSHAQANATRQHLLQMLDRDQVRSQLEALGVDPSNARERVQRMTDQEVAQLDHRMNELPAGGDAVGVVLLVFIVFIITDALGATDIFPFVHPVNN